MHNRTQNNLRHRIRKAICTVTVMMTAILPITTAYSCSIAHAQEDITEEAPQEVKQYEINGVTIPLDEDGFRIGDYRGSGTCWEFCQHVYETIWGTGFSQFGGTEDDILQLVDTGEARRISEETAREYISHALPGAVVRMQSNPDSMDANSGSRHSMIILDVTDEGCTVYHAWAGYVSIDTLTWAEMDERFCKQTDFGYFKYIKCPLASTQEGRLVKHRNHK